MADKRKRNIKIYVMTHKAFVVPPDPMYVPVHVGRSAQHRHNKLNDELSNEPLMEYIGDDSGDNISEQNCYYSELTGLYWVWKNCPDTEIAGVCHYRRYLINEQGYMFTGAEIEDILSNYDLITTKSLQLNYSYYEGFAHHHKIAYLDETARVIEERYPQYYETFMRLVHEKHTYFGNMFICNKALYDDYCQWLFDILFEVHRRVPVEEADSYHRRIFGFVSEFLLYVWVVYHRLRVCECMVGMLGEKAEVGEVKRELARYFAEGDYAGAKAFFLDARSRRPDLLMEASDVTGELHLCMEVIAIAGLEQERYGRNLLDRERDFAGLMDYCNRINRYALARVRGEAPGRELAEWAAKAQVTEAALEAAYAVMASAVSKGPVGSANGGHGK